MEDTFLINTPFKSVRVHPVVPFTILDHYKRRPKDSEEVLGTIMGTINNGVLEITTCFAVAYTFDEKGLAADGIKFNETLSLLYSTANKSDVVLGWFATVKSPVVAEERWFTMNNYYRTICQTFKPIFLTLDTNFNGDRIVVESYSVTSVSLSSEVLAIKLTKVPVEVSASHTENEVLQSLLGAEENVLPNSSAEIYNDMESLKGSMLDLMEILNETEEYITKVISGEITPSAEESRKVFNAIMSVPLLSEEEFKQMFLAKMRDFALVSHLSNLARREVELAEKMNSMITYRN